MLTAVYIYQEDDYVLTPQKYHCLQNRHTPTRFKGHNVFPGSM